MDDPCVTLFPAQDALGYLAAGERLNAGHQLYTLGPGDRYVPTVPGLFDSPFLYPPIFGVLWQPLAALPFGLTAWMAAVTLAVGWWVAITVLRGGTTTASAIALLGAPIVVTVASGNVNGLLMVGFAAVLARPRTAGLIVGMMAALKVFPALFIVWFLATRRFRAAAWAIGVGAAWTLAGFVLAGPAVTVEYLTTVVPSTRPMGISPAYLLQLPWLTYAIGIAGLAAIVALRSRRAAIATIVFGSPALGVALARAAGAGPRRSGEAISARLPRNRPTVRGRSQVRLEESQSP